MKDLFSTQSKNYATFRPSYPASLYDFIFDKVRKFDAAWDAGCGNGQVAKDVAPMFRKVFGTDISAKQLDEAVKADNIFYSIAGETTSFDAGTFDLITVGQAIHWFDREVFYKEVKRVGKPSGVIALWGYSLLQVEPGIDKELHYFYTKVVGPYWDAERKLVDRRYRTISFPFDEIKTPEFSFTFEWSLAELEGYLSTWSSVQKYITAKGEDPVPAFISRITPLWESERKTIRFPLFARIGMIGDSR
jgi:SAM-dependent methyltransferase